MIKIFCLPTSMASSIVCITLTGCLSEQLITQRPSYAYPQHLVSLCDEPTSIALINKGHFVTADYTNKSTKLLLSVQMLPADIETHRRITDLLLNISPGSGLVVSALDEKNRAYENDFPSGNFNCNDAGEFIIKRPTEGYYFWASYGKKDSELALWTNANRDLVVQSRWSDSQAGLVGGKVTGDAWAIFEHSPMASFETRQASASSAMKIDRGSTKCENLAGKFEPYGEVILKDGSVHQKSAFDHLFRERIPGDQIKTFDARTADTLELEQGTAGEITLNLHSSESRQISRVLAANDFSCKDGKWYYEGDVKAHSPWLLLAASAGVHWENMILWKDGNGDLLVESTYKSRSVLMLIPFGNTNHLFIAYRQIPRSE